MLGMLKARLKSAEYCKMETISEENAEVDEKEMEISQDCLGVPTILRNVLQQFSTKELIELSLVNKLWNFEARSVMKERGTLRANISSEEISICQQLAAFVSALEKMRVIPFSGIIVSMKHIPACISISDSSVFTAVLRRLPLKYFAVRFCGEWKEWENCFALEFVTSLLADFCGVLEELSLHEGRTEFYQNILQGRMLPCLKTLEVKQGALFRTNEPLTSSFIKGLVACAPNLEELRIHGAIHLKENVLRGSSAVLVPVAPRTFFPLVDHVCEDLISSLRATEIEIQCNQNEEVDPELLNVFFPMMLAASRTTLKVLCLERSIAAALPDYGICLENVIHLYIPLRSETRDNLQKAMSKLDLLSVLPKIKYAGTTTDKECNMYLWLSQAGKAHFPATI